MDVSDWRASIDDLDRKILALVNERARCVLQLAPLKRQKDIPIHEPRREQAVLSNLRTHNGGPLSDEAVCQIFEAIMQQMRQVQRADPKPSHSDQEKQGSSETSAAGRSRERAK